MPFVSIDGVSDEKLNFLGWDLVFEDDLHKLYRYYDGSETIVRKNGRPYIWIDDINDAIVLGGAVIHVPKAI